MAVVAGFVLLGVVLPLLGAGLALVGGSDDDPGGQVVVEGAPATPETTTAPASVDLLHEDPAAGLAWLRAAAGEDVSVATGLTFYPGYLVAEVEPAAGPGTVERWVLYPDRSIGPDPVAVMGPDRVALADVVPEVLRGVVAEAVATLAPGGRATHLVVRPGPADTGPEYSVYVERADGASAGYAVYGVLGNLLRSQPTP